MGFVSLDKQHNGEPSFGCQSEVKTKANPLRLRTVFLAISAIFLAGCSAADQALLTVSAGSLDFAAVAASVGASPKPHRKQSDSLSAHFAVVFVGPPLPKPVHLLAHGAPFLLELLGDGLAQTRVAQVVGAPGAAWY